MLFYKSVAAQNIYVVAVRAVFTARLIESNIAAVRRYIFYRYPRVFKKRSLRRHIARVGILERIYIPRLVYLPSIREEVPGEYVVGIDPDSAAGVGSK